MCMLDAAHFPQYLCDFLFSQDETLLGSLEDGLKALLAIEVCNYSHLV